MCRGLLERLHLLASHSAADGLRRRYDLLGYRPARLWLGLTLTLTLILSLSLTLTLTLTLTRYDLPVATGLTVAAATAFPTALAPLAPAAERLGTVALTPTLTPTLSPTLTQTLALTLTLTLTLT